MNKKNLRIAAPCTLDWQKMTPAEGGRFCGDCKKVVRDLSKMKKADARKLLMENAGDLCVRFVHNAKGDIFFADMNPVVPASSLNRAARAAFAAAVVALQPGCGSDGDSTFASDQSSLAIDKGHPNSDDTVEMMGMPAYDPDDYPSEDGGTDDTDSGAADVDADLGDVDGGAAPDAH